MLVQFRVNGTLLNGPEVGRKGRSSFARLFNCHQKCRCLAVQCLPLAAQTPPLSLMKLTGPTGSRGDVPAIDSVAGPGDGVKSVGVTPRARRFKRQRLGCSTRRTESTRLNREFRSGGCRHHTRPSCGRLHVANRVAAATAHRCSGSRYNC
jgi:hypothetical protein